jgi:hypothetical protein
MNETHLEHPDVETALAEVTEAVRGLTTEQELRHAALAFAIQVFLKPTRHEYDDIVKSADAFYAFLSSADPDD